MNEWMFDMLSLLFMLRLLSASQTGDLLFSLESVVYREPHNGNTHTHTHAHTYIYTHTVSVFRYLCRLRTSASDPTLNIMRLVEKK